MALSLSKDFKTVEELREAPESILAQVKKNRQPVVITAQGKPAAVMLDVVTFERIVKTINLVRLVGPAEEDILAGRTRPLDEFMSEFCRDNNIPSGSIAGSGKRRARDSQLHRTGQKERRRKLGS
ncbi:MAG: type II toxin-antitoxin system Phd/YefM family antitoxin [Planctomycetia bacterium]|nr:type II toxin-antitoxin system Phd/YefM family antitoxin [Planctomycetia bacterium]